MPDELRMRVFAGPNGSGKSTIIKYVREYHVEGKAIDFGIYVNADDIARDLRNNAFNLENYAIVSSNEEFQEVAQTSGLINQEYSFEIFSQSYKYDNGQIVLRSLTTHEKLAQILADFLRKKLIANKRKLSFETVFSHVSKLDIMLEAQKAGYKVYLYFVSTESPEINKARVALRVQQQGHNVPEDRIVNRYYRALEQLYDASQLAYQVYFWDNSDEKPKMFAHFKQIDGQKKWDEIKRESIPNWFNKYYLEKVPQ